jgi:hypothetical protein
MNTAPCSLLSGRNLSSVRGVKWLYAGDFERTCRGEGKEEWREQKDVERERQSLHRKLPSLSLL